MLRPPVMTNRLRSGECLSVSGGGGRRRRDGRTLSASDAHSLSSSIRKGVSVCVHMGEIDAASSDVYPASPRDVRKPRRKAPFVRATLSSPSLDGDAPSCPRALSMGLSPRSKTTLFLLKANYLLVLTSLPNLLAFAASALRCSRMPFPRYTDSRCLHVLFSWTFDLERCSFEPKLPPPAPVSSLFFPTTPIGYSMLVNSERGK
jgi:hypothetical protein